MKSDIIQNSDERVVSEKDLLAVCHKIGDIGSKAERLIMGAASFWTGELNWARNRVALSSDRRGFIIRLTVVRNNGVGFASTNQFDDESLEGVYNCAERRALRQASHRGNDIELESGVTDTISALTWSDETFDRTANQKAEIVKDLLDKVEDRSLTSAGYIETRGAVSAHFSRDLFSKILTSSGKMTQAECSITVRATDGTASGWAGQSGFDIGKISERDIADTAFEKCLKSFNPVRIEPGRYTAILEPQAVADLTSLLLHDGLLMSRSYAERGMGPFVAGIDHGVQRIRSKMGLKIMDERITISHDPSDPELGVIPIPGLKPVTWVKNGVLNSLAFEREYAVNELNERNTDIHRRSFRMSGGNTTIEEMIETSQRSLLVTRLFGLNIIDEGSMLSTGLTRDGLWLIENGKISKSIRNFRFTESPIFVFNNVRQLGVPMPVFSPVGDPGVISTVPHYGLQTAIVPPMKVDDFSFTSAVDAI